MLFTIYDVRAARLNYECENPPQLQEGAKVTMYVTVNISDHIEEKNRKLGEVQLELYLLENSKEVNESTIKDVNDGFYKVEYKIWFETDAEESQKLDLILLRHLEPYLKKGILDFSLEVGLPALSLPFEFWKNVQLES